VAAEAGNKITLEGQEKDVTTAGLARMNMILHDFPTANIVSGNTLANPKFKDGEQLRTYDYVVANPPFSDKTWSTGLTPERRPLPALRLGRAARQAGRLRLPAAHHPQHEGHRQGRLHPAARRAVPRQCRGVIRKQLVNSGILKGIIGLPANLFYGTGIPACILVLDKENAAARKGIFMIDASKGFIKDGNKNRLREQDIHRIVDTFTRQMADVPRYARLVPLTRSPSERTTSTSTCRATSTAASPKTCRTSSAHLRGGIPERDLFDAAAALCPYWQVMPGCAARAVRAAGRPGYSQLTLPAGRGQARHPGPRRVHRLPGQGHPAVCHLASAQRAARMKGLRSSGRPPQGLIEQLSEDLLATFKPAPLLDAYDVYQHLMDYWAEAMQDDAYLIAADGWVAKPTRIIETDKKGKQQGQGLGLRPGAQALIVARYFAAGAGRAGGPAGRAGNRPAAAITELEEEHSGDDAVFCRLRQHHRRGGEGPHQEKSRYALPMAQLTDEVEALAARVETHLRKMGTSWN
jgi:type I restriction enzyme M protein